MRNVNDHKLEPHGRYGPFRLYTVEQFKQQVSQIGPQGKGFYGTETLEGDDEVDPANLVAPGTLTHVIWYDKWPTGYEFPKE